MDFIIEDVNNKIVVIKYEILINKLQEQGFSVYGMGLSEISEFRKQYIRKGGKMPIAKEEIIRIMGS